MQVIRISAKRDGIRRAGIAHPKGPVDHPVDRFTAAQLAQLRLEPLLVIDQVEVPDAPVPSSPAHGERGFLDPAQLAAERDALDVFQQELDRLSAQLAERKAVLDTREGVLDQREKGLQELEARLSGQSKPGETDEQRRAAAIREAVSKLGPKDIGRDKKPNVAAIEKLVGFDTTRDEIDAALAAD